MSGDTVQPDPEYGPSRSLRYSTLFYPSCVSRAGSYIQLLDSADPGGVAGSTVHGVVIDNPPQSVYITDKEKVSQGEKRDSNPPFSSLFLF